jgi:dTDP-4-amino-4,6-dideoxygalactose transaminase
LAKRQQIDATYRQLLAGVKGVRCLGGSGEKMANYAYFPILLDPEYPVSRDALYQKFRDNNIFARRYFYPLIADFPMYRGLPSSHRDNLPVAASATERVICLPIFPDLDKGVVERIVALIKT